MCFLNYDEESSCINSRLVAASLEDAIG